MEPYFKRVNALTPTRMWVNNVTIEQAKLGIENGAVGCTQNPSFPWKILNNSSDAPMAKELLSKIMETTEDTDEIIAILQAELVANICKEFLPIYENSFGEHGWVSIQGNPFLENVDDIVRFALMHREYAPNVICKIPATKDGLAAIEELCRKGVPILATEVMSVQQAIDVIDIYERVSSEVETVPMYMAHIAGIFDEHLKETVEKNHIEVPDDYLWQAGILVAKKINSILINRRSKVRLLSGGARGLHHFTEMVGADADVTINWAGTADQLIADNPVVIDRFSAPIPEQVIDELVSKVPDFKKAYVPGELNPEDYESFGPVVRFRNSFEKGWQSCRDYIDSLKK